jgi:hypothetical protein
MFTQTNTTRGYTLIEMLFYIAGAVLFLGLIVTLFFNTDTWYRAAIIYPRINQEGAAIVGRIGNDIRSGSTLNSTQNVFGVTNGAIGINALDASRNAVTYYYYLQNGRIMYRKNGGTAEYASPDNVYISKMRFDQIDTPISTAVRFVVDIDYSTKTGTTTNSYSSLSIMKNSYE